MIASGNIYDNYQVFSPDGILMFRCNSKKFNWYLDKKLAEKIDDKKIRLNFKPKGLGNHGKYGLQKMKNICVVCGVKDKLNRHHVVPYCYRKYFPLEMKEHNFHDVLSLCTECHEKYERQADDLKNFLAREHQIPVNGIVVDNKELIKYSKMASTLLKNDLKIPKERTNEMKNQIKSKFGIKRLSKSRLRKLSRLKSTILSKTHGEIVVNQTTDIQAFVEMWRDHFVRTMNCKHLPKNWSIKSSVYND